MKYGTSQMKLRCICLTFLGIFFVFPSLILKYALAVVVGGCSTMCHENLGFPMF